MSPGKRAPSRRKSRCKGPEAGETLGIPGEEQQGGCAAGGVKGEVRAAEPGHQVTLPCRQEGSRVRQRGEESCPDGHHLGWTGLVESMVLRVSFQGQQHQTPGTLLELPVLTHHPRPTQSEPLSWASI